jgi:hypothetical protein
MFNVPTTSSVSEVDTSSKPNKLQKRKAARKAITAAIERIKSEVPRPRREQPYIFMEETYRGLLALRELPHWNSFLKTVRKASLQNRGRARDCFRYLIDNAAQGAVDGQKAKYLKILTFARVNNLGPEEMIKFVRQLGSINKAVDHIRNSKSSKKAKVSKSAVKRKRKG